MKPAALSNDLAIGIDIGGTKTAIGVVDRRDGTVLRRQIVPTPTRDRTGAGFLDELSGLAVAMRSVDGIAIDKLGIGVCELVDRHGEVVSGHRIHISREQIANAFRKFSEVSIDSDIRAAATAEARFGRGKGLGHWIYVNAGTGISSVLMNGPECFLGTHGWVFSLGMSPANLSASVTADAALIEEISGGSGLLALARKKGLGASTVRELIGAAASNSSDAISILTEGGRVLGATIALLVNTLDPEAIVVGGGIVAADSPYWQSLIDGVKKHTWHPPAKSVPVYRSALSNDAGLVGAAIA